MKLFNPHSTHIQPNHALNMTGIITHKNFDLSDTPAVITGGQAGIGREITA